jgi:outer membrane receptor protein involved in Fe transport
LNGHALGLALAGCACLVTPAFAQPRADQNLAAALNDFANARGVELLFDEHLVAGKRAAPVPASSTTEQALTLLLKDTGLTWRQSRNGAFVIVAVAVEPAAREAPTTAIADILVIGRHTLDADIRRSIDDAQPYRTIEHRTIDEAQPDTIDQFLKTRLPQNTQTISFNQTPFSAGGSSQSQIDLRGLGTAHTLVLVNGRRLPSVPGLGELLQPDVSALPVQSIDRVETLASTAGGIFGIGADGGVVNFVTKNDFDDATLVLQSGLSQRGDAAQRLVDAHIGYTSPEGHSRISIRYTWKTDDGLTFGSRDFVEQSRILRAQRVGTEYYLPISASINIASTGGVPLTLLPSLGGQSLNAATTFLPLDAPAPSTGNVAALLANAGKLDLTIAPDSQGSQQSLLTPIETRSVMATARQEIGSALVVYADYLRLESIGNAVVNGIESATTLAPGEQGNPFAQTISITYPATGIVGRSRTDTLTDRVTVGAILRLGHNWVANLDAATGRAIVDEVDIYTPISTYPINVFAGGASLADQLSRVVPTPFYSTHATNRLRDLNLRAAGPIVRLPAGLLSVTMTAELRDERAPGAVYTYYLSTPALTSSTIYQSARQTVGSLFAEARVPIISKDSRFWPLRGLEGQIAVRADRYEMAAPVTTSLLPPDLYGSEAKNRGTVTAVTASARIEPVDGLVIRGSYASGFTPPTQSQITPQGFSFGFFPYSDPKRPHDSLFSSVETLYLLGGDPSLRPQKTRTWSIGAILKPGIVPGLRLSLDYSVLKTDHAITDFGQGQFQYFLDNEALYPGRVTRTALTPADIAAGYTAGRVTKVDASLLSTGHSTLEALDMDLRYERTTGIGRIEAYAQATWEPRLQRGVANAASYNAIGSLNGPLAVRGAAGIKLSRGGWSIGVDGQGYGSYNVLYSYQPGSLGTTALPLQNALNVQEQGGSRIPAQAYVDAWTSLVTRNVFSRATLTWRFGIKNIFDKTPPIVVTQMAQAFDGIGYSPLGDPRGRRFEIGVIAKF